ncbi:MAG: four helix bundle protein [Prevotellaceae bacterium]|jgi:four helix bundle protein|nr:four helix bundle protein [Prevotellaceae bacterium]
MKENIVKQKSKAFAIRIVRLYQYVTENKKEYVLSKQLLRSGTSVGAMVCEAEQAETKKDFIHKMAIAQKEINESVYWLDLLKETDYLTQEQFNSINNNAIELLKILTSIIKTAKQSLTDKH